MKILVISTYFGPETSIGVLRINSYVKNWAESGCEVHVITMPFEQELPPYLSKLNNISVHQVPSLLRGSSRTGNDQSYSRGIGGIRKRIWLIQNFLKRNIFCNYLDPRTFWWPIAVRHSLKISNEKDFDFVFSTVPSYSAHSVAAFLKKRIPNLIWVADYRDLWSGNPIYQGCAVFRWIERIHERFILSKSDIISSINVQMIDYLKSLHGPKVFLLIPNGFSDYDSDMMAKSEPYKFHDGVNISYFGSVIPRHHNIQPVISAIKQLSISGDIVPGDLKLRFFGNSEALDQTAILSDSHLQPFVEFCGVVPRSSVFSLIKGSTLLLFLGVSSSPVLGDMSRSVVSGKIFELMISGVEIMGVGVFRNMVVADLILESKTGDIYQSDVEKIKNRLLAAVKGLDVPISPDWDYLNNFRRSVHADQFIHKINEIKSGQ
ncbi:hypothetical protein OE810_03285 [Rhodobacteraceae bacterium XHP0102]|nr:hypothetical protein [Rhodobacteraceae bacterium XHP0102]